MNSLQELLEAVRDAILDNPNDPSVVAAFVRVIGEARHELDWREILRPRSSPLEADTRASDRNYESSDEDETPARHSEKGWSESRRADVRTPEQGDSRARRRGVHCKSQRPF